MSYKTEEEQLEAIKQWWGKYGTFITMLSLLLLIIVASYKYWHWHREKIITGASDTYEQLLVAVSTKDNKIIRSYANQLINEYGQTIYADIAQLTLAKLYVAKHLYNKAIKILNDVAYTAKIPALREIARLRMASIYIEEKKYQAALPILEEKVDDPTYNSLINELKGDIYDSLGKYEKANIAYKEAIAAERTNGSGNLFLELKANELSR